MHHIIVGFDASESASAALTWAVDEARLHHSELTVWTVFDQHPVRRGDHLVDEPRTTERLRRAAEEITNGIPAAFRFDRGGVAAKLTAASADADLLVVGSGSRRPFTGPQLGPVTRASLYHSPCAVVVVRPQPHPVEPHGQVVVGVATSPHARQALRVAAEEARLRGAVLDAVHAVHWDHLGGEFIAPDAQQLVEWGERLVAGELAETGVEARHVVVEGHVADVLTHQSAGADLLVLGSRGHHTLGALLTGSTSAYCARHVECPVLIVRPVAAEAPRLAPAGR